METEVSISFPFSPSLLISFLSFSVLNTYHKSVGNRSQHKPISNPPSYSFPGSTCSQVAWIWCLDAFGILFHRHLLFPVIISSVFSTTPSLKPIQHFMFKPQRSQCCRYFHVVLEVTRHWQTFESRLSRACSVLFWTPCQLG